jgi:LuxR family transcriptional regulator, regulator of acetate metabolism
MVMGEGATRHPRKRGEDELIEDALIALRRDTRLPVVFAGTVHAENGLRLSAFLGNTTRALEGLAVRSGRGLGGAAAGLARPLIANDYFNQASITHDYDSRVRAEGIQAAIAVPVIVRGKVRAVLYGASREHTTLGDRLLSPAVAVARDLEQTLVVEDEVTARTAPERDQSTSEDRAWRERTRQVYAELRELSKAVDDASLRRRIDDILTGLAAPVASPVRITPRELDVLSLAALGETNAGIGENLGLTTETVKGYLRDAMRKLDCHTRLQAVTAARRLGLLP